MATEHTVTFFTDHCRLRQMTYSFPESLLIRTLNDRILDSYALNFNDPDNTFLKRWTGRLFFSGGLLTRWYRYLLFLLLIVFILDPFIEVLYQLL